MNRAMGPDRPPSCYRLPMAWRTAILLLAFACTGIAADDGWPNSQGEAERIRVSSEMVLVDASVVDAHGRPIPGLTQANFRLFENHAEKKISWFGEDEAPVSIVVVFDTSGSMDGKLKQGAEAVARLLRYSQTGDEFALFTFANQPQLVQTWTRDDAAIPAALMNTRTHGSTALVDALYEAGRYAGTAANSRRLLFVLTDGGDNNSRWRETQVLKQLQETDVELYAVDIHDTSFTSAFPGVAEGPALLERMCTGPLRPLRGRGSHGRSGATPSSASGVRSVRSMSSDTVPTTANATGDSIPWR